MCSNFDSLLWGVKPMRLPRPTKPAFKSSSHAWIFFHEARMTKRWLCYFCYRFFVFLYNADLLIHVKSRASDVVKSGEVQDAWWGISDGGFSGIHNVLVCSSSIHPLPLPFQKKSSLNIRCCASLFCLIAQNVTKMAYLESIQQYWSFCLLHRSLTLSTMRPLSKHQVHSMCSASIEVSLL